MSHPTTTKPTYTTIDRTTRNTKLSEYLPAPKPEATIPHQVTDEDGHHYQTTTKLKEDDLR